MQTDICRFRYENIRFSIIERGQIIIMRESTRFNQGFAQKYMSVM